MLRAGVPLGDMLRAACSLFGPGFNPLIAKKTLGFFEGGEMDALDAPLRELLMRASLEDAELAPMPRVSVMRVTAVKARLRERPRKA